jgi:hypothetical protein
MKTFAENLRDEIELLAIEVPKLREFFMESPTGTTCTALSYKQATDLGFAAYETQRDGVMVSLPRKVSYDVY